MSDESPKGQLFDALWSNIPRQAREVLGTDVTFGKSKEADGVGDINESYVAVLTADGPNPVDIFLIFDVGSAIAFGGLLVMMQEKVIREHIQRREMDEDELDAMGECVNQITSVFNTAFREVLGGEYHVRFATGGVERPEALDRYGDGDLAGIRCKVSVGKLHDGEFRLHIPLALFGEQGASDGGGVELSPEEQEALREATRAGFEEASGSVLLLTSERERSDWEAVLQKTGLGHHVISDLYEVRQACRTGDAGMVLVDADAWPSGGLPILARLLAWREVDAPIMMAASRPTRTHLISCLASGASSYVVKPVMPDQLAERVKELQAVWQSRP